MNHIVFGLVDPVEGYRLAPGTLCSKLFPFWISLNDSKCKMHDKSCYFWFSH